MTERKRNALQEEVHKRNGLREVHENIITTLEDLTERFDELVKEGKKDLTTWL